MASTAPTLHIICNAGSGSSDAHEARQQIEQVLASAGRHHDFILVDDPKRLPDIARQAADAAVRDNGAVVVAGGDGTINTVAQAVLPTGRPFGIVPQGTFNYSPRAPHPFAVCRATRRTLPWDYDAIGTDFRCVDTRELLMERRPPQ